MHPNPYGADLGDRDPVQALSETPWRIDALVNGWTEADFERTYAPGKWSARLLLVHLAQTEIGLGTRLRYALTDDGYTAQSFDQDRWLPVDSDSDARTALATYLALRRFNLSMWRRLSPEQRRREFTHPEYGTISVDWVTAQMAGHDLHHLQQFETIAAS